MPKDLSQETNGDNSPAVGRDYNDQRIYIASGGNLVKSPSIIGEIIQSMVPHIWNFDLQSRPLTNEFKIVEKIAYNGLVKYKQVVLDLGRYEFSIESEFEDLEQKQPGLKSRFLEYVNTEYKKTLGMGYTGDGTFDHLIVVLKEKYQTSSNCDNGDIYTEDADDAIQYILGWAFTKCKILEVPPTN